MDLFDHLPIAAIINKKFIALHGGISPELTTISSLQKHSRTHEPPLKGLLCDLLWSDPVDNPTGEQSSKFESNQQRGCSFVFGFEGLSEFLRRNGLISLIRAHEVQLEGFKMHNWSNKSFPSVITIFSAPNYCDFYQNKGAVIKFENNQLNIQQFNYCQHPYVLPNFIGVFEWSLPFVTEKVLQIYGQLFQKNQSFSDETDLESIDLPEELRKLAAKDQEAESHSSVKEIAKKKIIFLQKMMKMQNILRDQSEQIVKIKQGNNNALPQGLLSSGKEILESFLTKK